MIGLSVPEPIIVDVDAETIREQQIAFRLAGRAVAPSLRVPAYSSAPARYNAPP